MAARHPLDYVAAQSKPKPGTIMGIETILIVVGIVAVIAIVVATAKSKRKIEDQPTTPPTRGTVRPPSETDHH